MTTPVHSPRSMTVAKARLAGLLYVIVIVSAGFAEAYARGSLIVRGDAAATAANILAHEPLYRLGGVSDLVNVVCDIAVAVLFYELLMPVSATAAAVSSLFRLMGDVMVAVITFEHFVPLVYLGTPTNLTAFSPAQLQDLAYASIRLHSTGYNVGMVFFGCHCVLMGYLIYRSLYLPRVVGLLLSFAGLCYLINVGARFLSPPLAVRLSAYILWPGIVAEAALALWLLVKGLDVTHWWERYRSSVTT